MLIHKVLYIKVNVSFEWATSLSSCVKVLVFLYLVK